MKPKSPKHVFISFKTEEKHYALVFKEALEKVGYLVWLQIDLQCGHEWHGEIDKALNDAGAIIVLWSKVSHNSQWVRHEASQAMAMNRYAPVRIEAFNVDNPYNRIQATDINNWNGEMNHPGFQNLLGRLNQLMPPVLSPQKKILNYLVKNRIIIASLIFALLALWFLTSQNNFLKDQSKTSELQTGNLITITSRIKDQKETLSKQTDNVNSILGDLKLQRKFSDTQLEKQEVILHSLSNQTEKADKQLLLQSNLMKNTESVITTMKALKYPLSYLSVSVKFTESITDEYLKKIWVSINFVDNQNTDMNQLILAKFIDTNKLKIKKDYLKYIVAQFGGKIGTLLEPQHNIAGTLSLPRNEFYAKMFTDQLTLRESNVKHLLDLENTIVIVSVFSDFDKALTEQMNLSIKDVKFYIGDYKDNNVISLLGYDVILDGKLYYIGQIRKDAFSHSIF